MIPRSYQRWERSSFLYLGGNRSCCNPFENSLCWLFRSGRPGNKQVVSVYKLDLCHLVYANFKNFHSEEKNKIPSFSVCEKHHRHHSSPQKTPTTVKHIYLRVRTSGGTWEVSLSLKVRISTIKQHLWHVRLCNTDANM